MGTNVTTAEISQYYPTLQPLLSDIQDMIPTGKSSNEQQQAALAQISNASVAENQAFKDQLTGSLKSQVDQYVDVSYRLNDYNEIFNTNQYLEKELRSSERKLENLSSKLKNKIFISKQKSQAYEYKRNKIEFYKSLFLLSCFVIVFLITCAGYHLTGGMTPKAFYITTGITIFIYLIIVYLMVYRNSYRSHTDWHKYVWESASQEKNSGTCR